MFQPSQHDVRRFFCETYARLRQGMPLDPMQAKAATWVDAHPEYHADLADLEAALAAVYTVEDGRTNPFLHLSMHLSIDEQCAIDQPTGIRQAVELLARRHLGATTRAAAAATGHLTGIRQAVQLLAARRGTLHDAHHEVMECLGEMIWASQRSGLPPDGHAYLDAVRRRATR